MAISDGVVNEIDVTSSRMGREGQPLSGGNKNFSPGEKFDITFGQRPTVCDGGVVPSKESLGMGSILLKMSCIIRRGK